MSGEQLRNPNSPFASTALAVGIAWLIVGLPIAWGIFNSVRQAMQLFR